MKFIRVKMYVDSHYITENLFFCGEQFPDHVKALERFHRFHPSASAPNVNCVAETVDIDTESDYFKACMRCGAVV